MPRPFGDPNFSLGNTTNLVKGPYMIYAGDPEGHVEALPGSICYNSNRLDNSSTSEPLCYRKVSGSRQWGWVADDGTKGREGPVPLCFNLALPDHLVASGNRFLLTAPQDMEIQRIEFSAGLAVAADATLTNTVGIQIRNMTQAVNLCSTAYTSATYGFLAYQTVAIPVDQNLQVFAGDVLEVQVTLAGTGALWDFSCNVWAWPIEVQDLVVPIDLGTVTAVGAGVGARDMFVFVAPCRCYVHNVDLVVDTTFAAAAANGWSFQLANMTGPVDLLSAAQTTLAGGAGTMTADTAWNLAVDQNQLLAAGDLLQLQVQELANAAANLSGLHITLHLKVWGAAGQGRLRCSVNAQKAALAADSLDTLLVLPCDAEIVSGYLVCGGAGIGAGGTGWAVTVSKMKATPHYPEAGANPTYLISGTHIISSLAAGWAADTLIDLTLDQNLTCGKGDNIYALAARVGVPANLAELSYFIFYRI